MWAICSKQSLFHCGDADLFAAQTAETMRPARSMSASDPTQLAHPVSPVDVQSDPVCPAGVAAEQCPAGDA